ncbi:MAG: T9SS type A sorting domain-containing protein [Bacteroidota bacterium]
MRKNFTQLLMGFALVVGFTTMGYSQCDIDPPPGSIFNFQFDGGLDGWRTLDAAGFETTIGWEYSETGDITKGAFGPADGTVIGSESQCNGAMVMDSDFLDNNGLPNNFENGPCPAPCDGYLVSPVMDFSSVTTEVDISFFQALRQFQSNFFIYVSVDGGASNRDTIQINETFPVNSAHIMEEVRLPLCGLAGESQVVVTFHYNGNYYYWAVDDITLREADESVDMRVNSNFYTKVANYATPRNMWSTVPILADIENIRAYENPASTLHYRVRDGNGAEIFSASREYGPVPGCSTDENKLFDATYTMPNEEGFYSVEFEIDAAGDENQENDVITAPFKITEREFRKLPSDEEHGEVDYISGFRYGDGLLSWGSYFRMPHNDGGQNIETVTLGYSTSAQDSVPSPGFINVGVYQWVDINSNRTVDEGERVLLGQNDILIQPGAAPDGIFTIDEWLDENSTPTTIVPVDGGDILVVAHTNPFNENTNYFFRGVDVVGHPEYAAGANNLAHSEGGYIGGFGSFAQANAASHEDRHDRALFNVDVSNGVIWDIRMTLGGTVSTQDLSEDNIVNVFPSPASENVTVQLDLVELSKQVTIEITDMTGNRAGVHKFSNIKRDNLSIDVSDYPGGMYLMNIRTDAGFTSKKITVVR